MMKDLNTRYELKMDPAMSKEESTEKLVSFCSEGALHCVRGMVYSNHLPYYRDAILRSRISEEVQVIIKKTIKLDRQGVPGVLIDKESWLMFIIFKRHQNR